MPKEQKLLNQPRQPKLLAPREPKLLTEHKMPTHLIVKTDWYQGEPWFYFYVTDENYAKRIDNLELPNTIVKKIPPSLLPDLIKHFEKKEIQQKLNEELRVKLGKITYKINQPETARAYNYYPKEELSVRPLKSEERRAPGLGYFLEAIAVNHLQKQGMKLITNKNLNMSVPRKGQLHKIGVNPEETMEIGEYLRRLGRGIKISIEKARS